VKYILRILGLILLIQSIASCKKEEVPSLTTSEVTDVLATSASCGGTIINEGSARIIARGICYSKKNKPTILDNRTYEGSGMGTFMSNMSKLDGGIVYYVRAYATNAAGTGYGIVQSFTTLGQIPFAVTTFPTNVSSLEVTLNGTVNPNYLSTTVTFEYGTTTSYGSTIAGIPSPIMENIDSNISVTLSGLSPETTYHFRIKATNSIGTIYGEDLTFVLPSPVYDIDANIYQTVTIGTQTWMSENLKTTKYSDGTPIPLLTDPFLWLYTVTPCYCWLNDSIKYKDINGALYNWYSVATGNLCPTGWHVPTLIDWQTLFYYLEANGFNYDGTTTGNKYAKSLASLLGWESSSSQGAVGNTDYPNYRNKSGFTALWNGSIGNGIFNDEIGRRGGWWSSSTGECPSWWPTRDPTRPPNYNYFACFESLTFTGADVSVLSDSRNGGLAVRCLKDN
jgi:uncharacterized protein (TIGR02145 family)